MRVIGVWLITAIAVAVAVAMVPGVVFVGSSAMMSVVVFAAVLAVLNAFIKPLLQIVSLPITILTLGIFALIVNTAVLYLAAWLSAGLFETSLVIEGFGSAFLTSLIISVISSILNALTGVKDPQRR
jgi:putative membrane protein